VKIVISNTVALNGGDAAILSGLIRILRAAFGPDVRFTVFGSQPDVAARYYPEVTFRPSLFSYTTRSRVRGLRRLLRACHHIRWRLAATRPFAWRTRLLLAARERAALAEYASADLVVSTGGTYLVEIYSLEPRLFDFDIALRLGKPLVLFTQSLGPFTAPRHRRRLRRIFTDAALVLVRDARSRRHITELGVAPHRIRVAADAAFALADPRPAARPAPTWPAERLRVAISVREWRHFRTANPAAGMARYLAAVGSLVQHLVEHDKATVTLLSTCQGIPEYWTDDSRVAADLIRELPPTIREQVSLDDGFHRPQELIDRLREYDLLVATRMHMAILGLCAGVPVLAIAYEFKTTELFRSLGLGEWVHDIETVRAESLIHAVDALIARLEEIGAVVLQVAERERRRALASGRLTRAMVSASRHVEPSRVAHGAGPC
jgi:colanic acid/amylovoran biosynthesis protein